MSRSCFTHLLAFFLVMCCGCQSTPPTVLDVGLGNKIDALVVPALEVRPAPGLGILVVRDGVVVHAKGYGLANLETGEPITRTTPFRLASVTKQFTCMAILKLAEDGKLSVDDPAHKYVPTLKRFGDEVTIRRLMQHTSGLPEYYAELERLRYRVPDADGDAILTEVDATQLFEEWGKLRSTPGSQYAYSNPGYEQLALIVRNVSGKSFARYLQDEILEPAGMATAVLRSRPDTVIPGRAIGYSRNDDGFVENDDHPGNWIGGAGGLYASLDDFYFWDQALHNDRIVSAETQQSAYELPTLGNGRKSDYGFGWIVAEEDGRRCHLHGGGWVGFRTYIARYPDDDVTIVVLSNCAWMRPGGLARKVAGVVFAEPAS